MSGTKAISEISLSFSDCTIVSAQFMFNLSVYWYVAVSVAATYASKPTSRYFSVVYMGSSTGIRLLAFSLRVVGTDDCVYVRVSAQ